MKKTILMVALASLASAPSFAMGAMGTPVSEIHLHGMNAYAGRTLDVFYVSARPAALGVQGQSLEIREVKAAPVQVQIDASGNADVPATEVPRHGFKIFNYLVFAVPHDASQPLFLRNPDGTPAPDPRIATGSAPAASQMQTDYVGFICYSSLIDKSPDGTMSSALDLDALHDL